MSAFAASGIRKAFGDLAVLSGVDADFPAASVTAILGPSGCGKTTLLNIIAGLLPADSGSLTGFPEAGFSYSFQEPRLLPWLTASENVAFALSGAPGDPQALAGRAERFLRSAGLDKFAGQRPAKLSGGMKRRLSLARAFAYPSDVLLLDEAFSAVDLKLRIELMDLFSLLWREERRTTIMVTHDVQDALYLADRVLVLSSRPAKVLDRLEIAAPRESRRYGSRDFAEFEERLYEDILG
ncbi:ABC transporter ATP-binding protein [bacterium]|nr:ABC transporter ATP-binding protein [bacterium]